MRRDLRLLVSCEHGGNRVPARYADLFADAGALLDSHAGYDIGALTVARDIAAALGADLPVRLLYSTTTRLLVDLNRSVGHPRLHGEPVRALGDDQRRAIVERHHAPYRASAERWVAESIDRGARVVHLSCHSFTPALDGRARRADVGLLFDPRRAAEGRAVHAWRAALAEALPALRVRLNYPYRGTADGLTTALRRRFPDPAYAGVELEVNQALPTGSARDWRTLRRILATALATALRAPTSGRRAARPSAGPRTGAG
jgi:predicted N-formylglutamate amidohydrolase